MGRSARCLGVRVPRDIAPDADGFVTTGRGGMSVAPDSLWNLPHHRRPRTLGRGSTGPDGDHVFSVEGPSLEVRELRTRPDPAAPVIHAFVEPKGRVALAGFETALASTRPEWHRVWP